MAYRRTAEVESRLADKRQRIATAAREVVAKGGFREATVAAIAAVAGVSTGGVYSYFPSKADLMAEVVATVSEREVGVLREIAAADGSAADRLVAAIETFIARAHRGRRLAYALIAEPAAPEVDDVRLEYRRQLAGAIATILRAGIAEGPFRAINPDTAAAAVVGAFMEALIGPLSPDAPCDPDHAAKVARALSDFCLAAVSSGHSERCEDD